MPLRKLNLCALTCSRRLSPGTALTRARLHSPAPIRDQPLQGTLYHYDIFFLQFYYTSQGIYAFRLAHDRSDISDTITVLI